MVDVHVAGTFTAVEEAVVFCAELLLDNGSDLVFKSRSAVSRLCLRMWVEGDEEVSLVLEYLFRYSLIRFSSSVCLHLKSAKKNRYHTSQ
jgi:hypothetical protein